MSDFKKGDIVQLKSGGPLMTIVELGNYGATGPELGAKCMWFDGKRPLTEVFDLAALVAVDDSVQGGAF